MSFCTARVAPEKAVFRPALPLHSQPEFTGEHMTDLRKIEPNVWSFLEGACALWGRIHAEKFSQRMYVDMVERGVESPIEDMVYIALHVQCEARRLTVNEAPIFIEGSPLWDPGIQVKPQAQVGRYRVDFLVTSNDAARSVIVELDGHAFHDKDKHQRSYEKARDRHFVKAGYRVLHYTGSDVVADPYRVAFEILEVLSLTDGEPFDQTNPVGIG